MKILCLLLVSGLMSTAFANPSEKKSGPCKKIVDACSAAGFKRGEHKNNKGLWKDCVEPIKAGQTVAGVTVDASDLEACKMKRQKHQNKKFEKSEGSESKANPVQESAPSAK